MLLFFKLIEIINSIMVGIELKKEILGSFIESNCTRQLFIHLGKDNPDWIVGRREITKPSRYFRGDLITALGVEYEEEAYTNLRKNNKDYVIINKKDRSKVSLTKEFLNNLYNRITDEGYENEYCLIEFVYPFTTEFVKEIFKLSPTEELPVDIEKKIRPDILLIGNKPKSKATSLFTFEGIKDSFETNEFEEILQLTLEGIKPVSEDDLKTKIGINIIDVKITRPEKVGKKYFFEIIYYWKILYHYLKSIGMNEKFFVRVDNNGIFPQYKDLGELRASNLREKIIQIPFDDSLMLFSLISNQLRKFLDKIPCNIEDWDLNLQSICSRCDFIEDCIQRLKNYDNTARENWDLRLIPYTSSFIADQLKDFKNGFSYDTVKDVYENIDKYPSYNVPTPIFSEVPFLKMRSKALLTNSFHQPELGEVYSITLPKYGSISFLFDFETEPILNVVCLAGFSIHMYIFNWQVENFNRFNNWWEIWENFIQNKYTFNDVYDEIVSIFFKGIPKEHVRKQLRTFADSLLFLSENNSSKYSAWLNLNQPTRNPKTIYSCLNMYFSYINKGRKEEDENLLAEKIISLLYSILVIIEYTERYISTEVNPINSAIYYWSKEQVDYLKDFIERNLQFINADSDLSSKAFHISKWFNPSESVVNNPYQPKKVYDLRAFAETIYGIPSLINYTWHQLTNYFSTIPEYSDIFRGRVKTFYEVYWNKYFNFIDFQHWLRYLSVANSEKSKIAQELEDQIFAKLQGLDQLRRIFQKYGHQFISGSHWPKKMENFYEFDFPEEFHFITQAWVLFESYTAVFEELEIETIRSLYPQYGIGKLVSGKVNKIVQRKVGKKFEYRFELKSESSNMKISEGDWINIIPNLLRDLPKYKNYNWRITIDRLTWNSAKNCYAIQSGLYYNNLISNYRNELEKLILKNYRWFTSDFRRELNKKLIYLKVREDELSHSTNEIEIEDVFFVYPRTSHPWLKKLEALLNQDNYGTSWLGQVLSYMWDLSIHHKTRYPIPFPYNCNLPEIYMFAPALLPKKYEDIPELITNLYYPPDASQKEAITQALQHTIYGIQGPPGTGKTQTISSLIDNFINKEGKNRSIKILVMTFSYPALTVVFNTIKKSVYKDGTPTKAADSEFVFVRSKSRLIRELSGSYYDFFKSSKATWMISKKPDGEEFKIQNRSKLKFEDYLNLKEKSLILFANVHSLFKLNERNEEGNFKFLKEDFAFDLIIIDEGSQLPVNYFLAPLQYIKRKNVKIVSNHVNAKPGIDIISKEELLHLKLELQDDTGELNPDELTKVIIVGDQNQLPPIQPVKSPKNLVPILDNLFGYYFTHHGLSSTQLKFNYRSHQHIVDYTNELNIYKPIEPKTNRSKTIEGDNNRIIIYNRKGHKPSIEEWVTQVMNPDVIVCSLIHARKFETAVSALEAKLVTQIVLGYYIMTMPDLTSTNEKILQNEQNKFWTEKVGIVAPHNAQSRLIIRNLYDIFMKNNLNHLAPDKFMLLLTKTIFSVEKFQGSDRDLIVSSMGISAQDQLLAEQEFIYNLNRFNVLTSRAKYKFILVCSKNFYKFIPNDQDILKNASKIRHFPKNICSEKIKLKVLNEDNKPEEISFRFKK